MPTTTLRRSLALLAATGCAVLGFGASAAADAVDSPQLPPQSNLVLTIAPDPDYAVSGNSLFQPVRPRSVTLTCNPDGGSHPAPEKACEALREVDGYFERLPSIPNVFCPAVWDPVRVTATGNWGNRRVVYAERFGNSCEAGVGTNGVFFF